ncbi:MAG: hypothetical protein NTV21_06840 [Planctomycetota bacterium]|nr:hypothetical protein [Planctomycetota bacterium]
MRPSLLWIGLMLCPTSFARQAATTTFVSLGNGGLVGNGISQQGVLTADGSVVFHSVAANFGALAGGGLFLRDPANTSTSLLSLIGGVTPFPANAFSHDVSRDGRFLVVESQSPSVVPGDTNGVQDVFLLDRSTGNWQRVSVSSSGVEGNGGSLTSLGSAVSDDGRFVAFASAASNFVAGDVANTSDIFVRDTLTGVTECVSTLPNGIPAGSASEPAISADGRIVAFFCNAPGLVAGDTFPGMNLFVRDRQLGVTRLIDWTMAGTPASGVFQRPALSGDGRFVAFTSSSSQLVPGDTNNADDVYCADLTTNVIERISVSSAGVGGNLASLVDTGALVSFDGRFIAFSSAATNLVPGDTNAQQDCFLRDRLLGTTERVSLTPSGAQASHSSYADSVSDDGRLIAFTGYGNSFVPGDTNNFTDVFLRSRGGPGPQPYCTAGTSVNGCVAQINANVNPNTSSTAGCILTVSGADGNRSGLIFYGTNNLNFVPTPWFGGSSFHCVRAPYQRTGTKLSGGTSGACNGTFVLDWDLFQQTHPSALGTPWSAGNTVFAQGWIRDPASPGNTTLSNALVLRFQP